MNRRLKELNKTYDIEFPSKSYIFYSVGDETYIISKPTSPTNLLASNIKIYHFGLKIMDSRGRPTYNYAQLFGKYAKDNYITIPCEEFNRLLHRGYIDKSNDEIIEDKGTNKTKILKIMLNNKTYPIGFVIQTDDKYIFDIPRHFEELIKNT